MQVKQKRFRSTVIKFSFEVLIVIKNTCFFKKKEKMLADCLSADCLSANCQFGRLSFRCFCVGGLSVDGLSYNQGNQRSKLLHFLYIEHAPII